MSDYEKLEKVAKSAKNDLENHNIVSETSEIIGNPPTFSVNMPNGFDSEMIEYFEDLGLSIDMVNPRKNAVQVWLKVQE